MGIKDDNDYFPFEGSEEARKHVMEWYRSPEGRAMLRAMAERREDIPEQLGMNPCLLGRMVRL